MPSVLRARDPGYPPLLATVPSPPDLHARGELVPDDALAIAIVGTRRPSPYGIAVAEMLARDLAARGVTIVSGLARGIDTAAHRGALAAGGRTIAVLGTGIDVVYPGENRALLAEIERAGAAVSQFPPGAPADAWHFPVRNRTIAGLALGVVVVEAGERSGALITAGFAGDLGREVFAVPGPVTAETSRGPNRLIMDGAKLVRNWTDVVQELPEPWRRAVRDPAGAAADADPPSHDSDDGRVLALLTPHEPLHIERLLAASALSPGHLARTLVRLELAGWVRQMEGQRWVARPQGAMTGTPARRR
jgi:DNA processing protein